MFQISIDGKYFFFRDTFSLLEVCQFIGSKIPRFCYHETLSIAGNCRMCLVKMRKSPKPIASCATPLMPNLGVLTKNPAILKSRENVIENLLLSHPLDCPVCDQAGNCELQDQSFYFGIEYSRSLFTKRAVSDYEINSFIYTIMNRCIHCTRCIRFSSEYSDTQFLGMLNRGFNSFVGTYVNDIITSEISSNIIDLCPVGALNENVNRYIFRPWEYKGLEAIALNDNEGNNIFIKQTNTGVRKISPRKNRFLNKSWISDKNRFYLDSLSFNRLSNSNKYKLITKSSNTFPIFNFEKLRNINQKFLFLFPNSVSNEILESFQLFQLISKNKIFFRLFSKKQKFTNLYNWGYLNDLSILNLNKSNFLCLLTSNIRVENTILNTKIKSNFCYNNNNVFNLGNFYHSSFNIFTLNLNINTLIKFCSFKQKFDFFNTKFPVLIVGQSLYNFFYNISHYLNELTKKIPTLTLYIPEININSSNSNFWNFKSYSKRLLLLCSQYYFFYISNSIDFYNLLLNKKTIHFFNSHNDFIVDRFLHIRQYSLCCNEEFEGSYFNFEQNLYHNKAINIVETNLTISVGYTNRLLSFNYFAEEYFPFLSFYEDDVFFNPFPAQIKNFHGIIPMETFYKVQPLVLSNLLKDLQYLYLDSQHNFYEFHSNFLKSIRETELVVFQLEGKPFFEQYIYHCYRNNQDINILYFFNFSKILNNFYKDTFYKNNSSIFFKKFLLFNNNNNYFYTYYPLKSILEEFYCHTNSTFNSPTLQKASNNYKLLIKTFFKFKL